jgi:hypothetical protein
LDGSPLLTDDKALLQRFQKSQEDLVVQAADLSLRTVATMVEGGAIDVSPQFQRRDRWNAGKQSALIESFILNIPVPPVYLAEDDLGTFSVIDGKQRITAIAAFLSGHFSLRRVRKLEELDGLKFAELPRPIQQTINLRPLRSVTLLKQSDPDLKYEVFHRLNSYGEILNAQEIRNVIFRGPLNRLIYQLAENVFLRQQLKITSERAPAYRKMQDAEYVLRFLTLERSWDAFSGDLARSMNDFMEANRNLPDPELEQLSASFLRAIRASEEIWGENAFKRAEGDGWRDQAIAGMYDAQMVAIGELSDQELRRAEANASHIADRTRLLFEDPLFDASVRVGTNTPSRIQYRVARLRDELRSIAQ